MADPLRRGRNRPGFFRTLINDVREQAKNDGWRSVSMAKVELVISAHAFVPTMMALGRAGILELIDMNAEVPPLQRHYSAQLSVLFDMERSLRYIHGFMVSEDTRVPIDAWEERPVEDWTRETLLQIRSEMSHIESELRVHRLSLEEMMVARDLELEASFVLDTAAELFGSSLVAEQVARARPRSRRPSVASLASQPTAAAAAATATGGSARTAADMAVPTPRAEPDAVLDLEAAQHAPPDIQGLVFVTIAGVLPTENRLPLSRLLFRALRTHVTVAFSREELVTHDSAADGGAVRKVVFLALVRGVRTAAKTRKLCESLHARLHDCPESPAGREARRQQALTRLADLNRVIASTQQHIDETLQRAALKMSAWATTIRQAQALFHALNMVQHGQAYHTVHGWCPKDRLDELRRLAQAAAESVAGPAPTADRPTVPTIVRRLPFGRDRPPTLIRTNALTRPVQAVVDAYGVPRYREINPALVATATFPFLFAVMFGDVGHGLVLLVSAVALLIAYARRPQWFRGNEVLSMVASARWLLLLMGFFSIFTGLLYNEWLSRPVNLFGSAWTRVSGQAALIKDPGRTYPFGVDPAWKDVSTEISFYNSVKMKVAIIFGVGHMCVGLVLKLLNQLHARRWSKVLFECLPEFLMLLSLFGYLCILIFVKWYTDFVAAGRLAPSLITLLINFFLAPGSVPTESALFRGQGPLQLVLFLVFALCPLVMLIGTPLVVYVRRRRGVHYDSAGVDDEGDEDEAGAVGYAAPSHAVPDSYSDLEAEVGGPGVRRRRAMGSEQKGSPRAHRLLTGGGLAGAAGKGVMRAADRAAGVPHPDSPREDTPLLGARAAAAWGVTGDDPEPDDGGGGGAAAGTVSGDDDDEAEHQTMGELIVHQIIYTIEYVLGTISNTASYLRLWALSLAHSQLATVFWNRVLMSSFVFTTRNRFLSGALMFLCSAGFAGATLGVIMMMELLSSFLHTLRLHWVEFQNKFYAGDGRRFRPFTFRREDDDDDR